MCGGKGGKKGRERRRSSGVDKAGINEVLGLDGWLGKQSPSRALPLQKPGRSRGIDA